jgi:hypothetical protein
MFVLTVQVDATAADFTKRCHGDGSVVYVALILAVHRYHTPDNYSVVLVYLILVFLVDDVSQGLGQIIGRNRLREHSGYFSFTATFANMSRVGPSTEQQVDGSYDYGFARARLAGYHIKALFKFDSGFID